MIKIKHRRYRPGDSIVYSLRIPPNLLEKEDSSDSFILRDGIFTPIKTEGQRQNSVKWEHPKQEYDIDRAKKQGITPIDPIGALVGGVYKGVFQGIWAGLKAIGIKFATFIAKGAFKEFREKIKEELKIRKFQRELDQTFRDTERSREYGDRANAAAERLERLQRGPDGRERGVA